MLHRSFTLTLFLLFVFIARGLFSSLLRKTSRATYQLNPMSPSGGGFGCGFSFLQGCGRLRVCSLSRDEKLGCSLPHPEPVVRGTCRSPAPASSSAASASLCWAGTTAGAGTWQKFCRLHVAGDNETCAVRAAWPPPVLPALQLSLAFWHY